MAKKTGFDFMITFVQEYLDGEMDRLGFDLDFNHYLIKHYPKMERENPDMADCFAFYLAEQGFDRGDGLSDADHKKLIRKQCGLFKSVASDDSL